MYYMIPQFMYYQTFLMEVVISYAETKVTIQCDGNSCIISFSINIDASLINNTSIIVMICLTSIHVLSNIPYESLLCPTLKQW